MRRYQMWLAALGIAMAPSWVLAGPLSFGKPAPKPQGTRVVRAQAPASNQDLANSVAKALGKANLRGSKIAVESKEGVVALVGTCKSPQQAKQALEAASRVNGVRRVENRLQIPQIAQAGYQDEGAQQPTPAGPPPMVPAQLPPGPPPQAPYAQPAGMPSSMVYDQPNLPNYAWPSYAQYPNSAAVNYPTQYSASAWPYIGPFYPYPQVPLGWRKAQLEWDDGYWQLNFRPRTDRWWWFLDYKNW